MRFWTFIDADRPDPLDPWCLFRTPAAGGPPAELWMPDGTWMEEPELLAFFTGDDIGAAPIEESDVPKVQAALRARVAP